MDVPIQNDYAVLDQPEVLRFLFHPRQEHGVSGPAAAFREHLIPVAEDITIGARFYIAAAHAPSILFFHGNGEIVADYDDIAMFYLEMGVNFLPVDYRGYGRSNGQPTVAGMMADGHAVYRYVRRWLKENDNSASFVVMGRSLGSAAALELASAYANEIDALILESGFAYAAPLLRRLGINVDALGFEEGRGFRNVDKIRDFERPTLIIHAEFDHIIPFADGQALYDASTAAVKDLLKIPGADHNDIFMRGMKPYLEAIAQLIRQI